MYTTEKRSVEKSNKNKMSYNLKKTNMNPFIVRNFYIYTQ